MASTKTKKPKLDDLRVWWVPQITCKAFEVSVTSVADGKRIMDILADYDTFQFEHNIKPDYSTVGGIQRYENDPHEGPGWYDLDE